MQFIAATPDHFPEIARLVHSAEELYLVYPAGHFPWDVEQLERLYRERRDFTLAIVDGRLAAFANLYHVQPGQSAFLGNIIVADEFKGQGIGKALTQHMIKLCLEKHHATPHLSVFGFNARAMLLYKALGFKPYDVEPREYLDGSTVALVHMRLAAAPLPDKQTCN